MASSAASCADEAVSRQTVEAAAVLVRDHIGATPCVHSQALSELTGVHIFRKLENLQYVPGELAKAAELVGAMGANIVQVLHQRIFAELPLQATELQFVLQTRGPAHQAQITSALRAAGHEIRVDRAGAEDEAGE